MFESRISMSPKHLHGAVLMHRDNFTSSFCLYHKKKNTGFQPNKMNFQHAINYVKNSHKN